MAMIIKSTPESATNPAMELPATPDVQTVAFNLEEFQGQADRYLDTVRSEAARIVGQAHTEAEQIRQQAEAAGKAAAESAIQRILEEKVATQLKTLLPALDSAISQIVDAKSDWTRHWQSHVVHLAASIAERIIRRQLEKQPEIGAEWIQQALELAGGAAEVTLRLNPADHESLGNQVTAIQDKLSLVAALDVVADDSISAGGCRVETRFGSVDNQLETQLARIEEELSR